MGALGSFTTKSAGQKITADLWNTNFNAIRDWANAYVLLSDVAKTVSATHTYSASQTFTGGWTAGAACTVSAGGLTVTAGGLTITAGGLTIAAGTLSAKAVTATTGVFSSALDASAGLTAAIISSPSSTGITLNAASGQIVQVKTNATNAMYWNTSGSLLANSADLVDIGDASAHRMRSGYFGGVLRTGLATGGGTVQLMGGVADHCYLEWYARTASPSTRSAFMGFGSVGTTQLSIWNETAGQITFASNNTARWTISSAGHFIANTHNAYDIGQSGGTGSPRNVYIAGVLSVGGNATVGGTLTAATLSVTGAVSFPSLTLAAGLVCTTISCTTINGTVATLTGIAGAPNFSAGYTATASVVNIGSFGTTQSIDPRIPHHTFVNGANTYTFTIAQSGTPVADCTFAITFKAHAAAAFGTITWPATWLLAGAFANPATGKNRTYVLRYSAADNKVYEVSRTAADVSN